MNGSTVVTKKPKPKSAQFTECEREYAILAARAAAAQGTGKRRYHRPTNLSLKPATFVYGQVAVEEPAPDILESMLHEVRDDPIPTPNPIPEEVKKPTTRQPKHTISNGFAALEDNDDEVISFSAPSFQLPTSFSGNNLTGKPIKSPYEAFHARFNTNTVSNTRERKLSEDEESL